MMDDKFRSRKFTIAILVWATSSVALFTGPINGDQFVWIAGILLSLYGAANVAEKWKG